MRLVYEVAAERILYPRPIATVPDILLIGIAPVLAGEGLPLGRYYPVILETNEERLEFERFLHQDRSAACAPDLLDRRPSALTSVHVTIALYAPPEDGWP